MRLCFYHRILAPFPNIFQSDEKCAFPCPSARGGGGGGLFSLFSKKHLSRVTFGAPFNIYPVFSDRVCASQRQQLDCCHFADALSVKLRSCFLKMQETRQLNHSKDFLILYVFVWCSVLSFSAKKETAKFNRCVRFSRCTNCITCS